MLILVLLVVGVSCDVNVIDNAVIVITTAAPNVTVVAVQDEQVNQGGDGVEQNDDYVVETEHGRVKGYKNNDVVHYFDIPYGRFTAESPFEDPSEPESWGDIHDKLEHTSVCPQIDSDNNYIGNHECLTLSVFKPENAENADVLFHIHDSSFNCGSGNSSKYGPNYLAPHGVILVLPNYRLGPLGFLCMLNETAPGNAGLKDLTRALQWTKNNIKAFGGNDTNIVLSGSGAAGALVEYLILSNSSRPLVSKAIVESGFVLSPWALDRQPLETARLFLTNLTKNEIREDTGNLSDEVNLETLVRAGQNIHFRPCVKNETGFLTESPWYLLNNEKIEITIMSGSANHAAMDRALQQTEESLSEINENCSLLLPDDLRFNNDNERIRRGQEVKTHYFGENNITLNEMEKLSQCYSDSIYLHPGIRGARLLAKGGATVYFYEFSYGNNHPLNGSARGDILSYVFSNDGSVDVDAKAEDHLQDVITDLWVSFIKMGKPVFENIEWSQLNADEESEEIWLSIGNEVSVQKGFHQNRLKLWDEIYDRHFVEHNVAFKLNCSRFIVLLGFLFSLKHVK